MSKMIKKWAFKPVQTRQVEEYLNRVSSEGEEVFGVYSSATVAGSLDILTYHKEEDPRPPAPKPVTEETHAKAK